MIGLDLVFRSIRRVVVSIKAMITALGKLFFHSLNRQVTNEINKQLPNFSSLFYFWVIFSSFFSCITNTRQFYATRFNVIENTLLWTCSGMVEDWASAEWGGASFDAFYKFCFQIKALIFTTKVFLFSFLPVLLKPWVSRHPHEYSTKQSMLYYAINYWINKLLKVEFSFSLFSW